MHARLAEHITPYTSSWQPSYDFHSATGLAAINGQVTAQAAMIAYNNDFKLLLWLSLGAIPLVLMLRKAHGKQSAPIIAE